MKQHDISIRKTARFFTLGNSEAKELWIVLHGYGQLANYFLKKFEPINDGHRLIVAPEGLHRFYWEGFNGRIVASWMTKEDRLSDIQDYVQYLDQVVRQVDPKGEKTIHVLGFSQGAATACRWALQGHTKIHELIVWAGAFPKDINYFENAKLINAMNLKVLVGTDDAFISEEQLAQQVNWLKSKELRFDLIRFNGGHTIYEAPLLELISDQP